MNDNMALLALKAADIVGLHVPEDMSVAGFDDMDMASYLATPLTSVAQDAFAIGKRAAELLIERIEGWYVGEPRSERIATQLRVRASTSAPRLPESPTKVNVKERPRNDLPISN
jgi:DNA-binding LacI/PurR family transcriptional regulator